MRRYRLDMVKVTAHVAVLAANPATRTLSTSRAISHEAPIDVERRIAVEALFHALNRELESLIEEVVEV